MIGYFELYYQFRSQKVYPTINYILSSSPLSHRTLDGSVMYEGNFDSVRVLSPHPPTRPFPLSTNLITSTDVKHDSLLSPDCCCSGRKVEQMGWKPFNGLFEVEPITVIYLSKYYVVEF